MTRTATCTHTLPDLVHHIPESLISLEDVESLIQSIIEDREKKWFRWGNCVWKDSELFEASEEATEQTPRIEAREICEMCPVKDLCAKQALDNLDEHVWTVMGGVTLPYSPRKSKRAIRQLKQAAEGVDNLERKIAWHIAMSINALQAKDFNSAAAWAMIHSKVDWGIFVRTCTKIGVKSPYTGVVRARIPVKETYPVD